METVYFGQLHESLFLLTEDHLKHEFTNYNKYKRYFCYVT